MNLELAQNILKKVKDDYDFGSECFARRANPWESIFELIKKQVGAGKKVLDVGCGDGRYFEALDGMGVEYTGVDSCEELIEKAKDKFQNSNYSKLFQIKSKVKNPNNYQLSIINYQVADILDLPFGDGKFSTKGGPALGWDVVLCIAVLHHIPSRELQLKALEEMHRVLKPGGKLIMTNWHLLREAYKPRRIAILLNCYIVKLLYCFIVSLFHCSIVKNKRCLGFKDLLIPWGITGSKIKRYYYAFSLAELRRLVKKSGFNITDKYYIDRKKKSSFWESFWGRGNIVVVAEK